MGDNIDLQEIRNRILSDDYGKFDLIENIITRQEILNSKPRIIFKKITQQLSIPEDKINRNTFWSWLRRYKKLYGHIDTIARIAQRSIVKHADDSFKREVPDLDWLENFTPSEPENSGIEPVVINVVRSEKNSKQT